MHYFFLFLTFFVIFCIFCLLTLSRPPQSTSLSIDLKDDKILCVAMHPGWVKTDMGGSHAPLTVEESCSQMAETIFALNESHNGGFIQYNGERLEW